MPFLSPFLNPTSIKPIFAFPVYILITFYFIYLQPSLSGVVFPGCPVSTQPIISHLKGFHFRALPYWKKQSVSWLLLDTLYTVENEYLNCRFVHQYCTLNESKTSVTVLGKQKEDQPMMVSI